MNYLKILINKIEWFNKKHLIKCVNILFKFNRLVRKLFVKRINNSTNTLKLELVRTSILEFVLNKTKMKYEDLIVLANYA